MTFALVSPRALYRDARLSETDRLVLLTALDEGMLDAVEYRTIKLASLASALPRRAGGRTFSRAVICRALDRLVRTEYLDREEEGTRGSPRKYRIRLSAISRMRE